MPFEYWHTMSRALDIINTRIRGHYQCDAIFSALPGGKDFKAWFDDPNVWINYDSSNAQGDWGWTMPGAYPKDIVVSRFSLRMGRWSTAATIIHELAHLNGADGHSHAAENTLQHCGLKSPQGPYNPSIRG